MHDPSIYKAYDIRGIVDSSLTESVIEKIARSFALLVQQSGEKAVALAYDGRLSSPKFSEIVSNVLAECGLTVYVLGATPTPLLYYATHHLDTKSGVMITASHNPPEYNGLKLVLNSCCLSSEGIQNLRHLVEQEQFGTISERRGEIIKHDIVDAYLNDLVERINIPKGDRGSIAIDAGNGVAGNVARRLYQRLGYRVNSLYEEIDGNFPNHHPDPTEMKNLVDLQRLIQSNGYMGGFAFDGDGDRLGVLDASGNLCFPDKTLMVLARETLQRSRKNGIIFDVKCSRFMYDFIKENGGDPIISRTGHIFMKDLLRKTDEAILAGEMSGHIFFKSWYGFDDPFYASAILLEITEKDNAKDFSALYKDLPKSYTTGEIKINLKESDDASEIIKKFQTFPFPGAVSIIDIDGVRVEYENGFGLLRASNTTPVLVMCFEGKTKSDQEEIAKIFYDRLRSVDWDLLPEQG